MNRIIKHIATLGSIATCLCLIAATALAAPAGYQTTTITGRIASVDISTYNGVNAFRVRLEGNPLMCTSSTAREAIVPIDIEVSQIVMSLLVSAKLAGRPVKITSYGPTGGNLDKVCYVDNVQLQ